MHPLVAVVGHNEADVYGCWSAEHLRARMPFERELAQRVIGDLGGRYAMVSFAVGNPDILSHDVERVWRNEYLPWVNALATTERLLLDYHSYYPHAAGLEQIARTRAYFDEHTPWHTNRWHWFYEVGTDTRVKTISSETGLDEYGRGGFNTGVFHLVRPWAEYFRIVTDAPLRNGAPSPFLFGTVFCVADDRWRGYDVRAAWRELL
ncbi:MAG: hypothetical protein RML84_10865 [Anaerolineae bacterium]|nr:hypothetical protein [Anaerolineae bacterium]